ncbi:MAG: hypothetical protein U0572_03795 [Phycisphaerales bacterium]
MHTALAILVTVAAAQQATAPRPPQQPQQQVSIDQWPWPMKMGARALSRDIARPIAPQVVLVPDAATYLDEIGKWSPEARWPVLFDEDQFAPMFVRAFKPTRVVRRASVGAPPASKAQLEAAIRSLASKAVLPKDPSPCVAVTSADDPAWTAAAALAAGRGMDVVFVDGDFGRPNDVLGADGFAALDGAIKAKLDALHRPWRDLGDDIDAIALCRAVAAKAQPNLEPSARPPVPPNAMIKLDDPVAVTDALARKPDGARSAIVGWIFGDEARSAYMAMSSMFLPRKEVLFHSGYANTQPWSLFDPAIAIEPLKKEGFETTSIVGPQAGLSNWLKLLMGGLSCDVFFMNSSGEPDIITLFNDEKARAQDVPFFTKPTALHLIHSWSLTRPDDHATVGGRMLDHGVYAYYGSVQEPLLAAFLPPGTVVQRSLALAPFLVSARMLDGPLDKVWRCTVIGDPLCMLVPAQKASPPAAPLPEIDGTIVSDDARAKLRAFADKGNPADAASAMRSLVMIGDDKIAKDLWPIAKARGAAAAVAEPALGPLFRQRMFDEFLAAFQALPKRDERAIDMLWQLATPRIMSLDEDRLMLLRSVVRGPDTSVDLGRLLPGFDRAMGRGASDRIVNEEIDRAKDPAVRAKLSELLRR